MQEYDFTFIFLKYDLRKKKKGFVGKGRGF